MKADDEFVFVRDLIPSDALGVVGVRAAIHMTPEGRTVMTYDIDGTAPTTTVVGLLEWLKHTILTGQAEDQRCRDEDR